MSIADDETLASIRARAQKIIRELSGSVKEDLPSWVRGGSSYKDATTISGPDERSARCRYFDNHGFIHVPAFADADTEISAMKKQMQDLASGWDPKSKISVFRTDEGQTDAQGSDNYFLTSASKVHFFTEKDATDEDGELKREFVDNKMAALNKAGHGMHMIPGAFRKYATSQKVRALVIDLGWVDPVVPQSMYIFKQPHVGGEVTSHQDSTFLYTEPRQTCLGLWLALDDATLENGCLWIRPGSHQESVRRKFSRNPEHFGTDAIESRSSRAAGNITKPQMMFEQLVDDGALAAVPWDGKLPEDSLISEAPFEGLFKAGFVPVECKAGDLLAFCGELDHLSLPNYSPLQRHTFQLHLVDGRGAGVEWAKSNWLQYPQEEEFLSVKM